VQDMSRSDFIIYKGHLCDVAVPFIGDSTRLFWITGFVTNVSDDSLLVKRGDTLKRIFFKEICDIHLSSKSI